MMDEKEIAKKWFEKGLIALAVETGTLVESEAIDKAFEIRWKDRETSVSRCLLDKPHPASVHYEIKLAEKCQCPKHKEKEKEGKERENRGY